jgi:hypothetical protein
MDEKLLGSRLFLPRYITVETSAFTRSIARFLNQHRLVAHLGTRPRASPCGSGPLTVSELRGDKPLIGRPARQGCSSRPCARRRSRHPRSRAARGRSGAESQTVLACRRPQTRRLGSRSRLRLGTVLPCSERGVSRRAPRSRRPARSTDDQIGTVPGGRQRLSRRGAGSERRQVPDEQRCRPDDLRHHASCKSAMTSTST